MKKNTKNQKLNKFQSTFDYKWWLNDFAKFTGMIPAIIYYRMRNIYIDKESKKSFHKEPCIIIANHHSFLDPITCLSHFWFKRTSFLTTKSLWSNKVNSFLFNHVFNCIAVDKDKVSIQLFKDAKANYNRGHSIVIYPEGTVAHASEAIDQFKSGAIMIASMTGAPIYPAYIVKRKHWYQTSKVIIGKRFELSDYIQSKRPSAEEMNQCSLKLFEAEQQLQDYAKEHHYL